MPIKKTATAMLALPQSAKVTVAMIVDGSISVLAVWIALYLRLDHWVAIRGVLWLPVVVSAVMALPIFLACGLYRSMFRHAGWSAVRPIAQACLAYGFLYSFIFVLIQIDGVPRTIGLIQPILLFIFVVLSRVAGSYWLGGYYLDQTSRNSGNVLIYGAGSAGRQLAAALRASELRVCGFIDDDARLQGRVLLGYPIKGPDQLPALVERNKISDILLAIPSISRARRNQILELLRPLPVAVRTLPGLTDLAQGRVTTSDVRELDLDDLLGRDAVEPNQELMEQNIRGKVVLVTGAGGSIGSELCRQILMEGPTHLLLVEISEPALYSLHQELEGRLSPDKGISAELVPLLASAYDGDRMRSIMKTWRPNTVYHAAAYKHVPLVEQNPIEGVRNNVFGTLTTAVAAQDAGVGNFVFISTDKAVRPTNVMGTSKRLAELVLQALARSSGTTLFSMVRFGNVLGSSGSVVPLFRQQIRNGGPITITHADITRYFMTIPEAAQLVIQAGAMAQGGEVFVLDMGEPVKIIDLARNMIKLSGLTVREEHNPEGDIEILVVGLRPGEKLYEELLIGDNPEQTRHPRIMKANEYFHPWAELNLKLRELEAAIEVNDVGAVLRLLKTLVPEYRPDHQVTDWMRLEKIAS